MGHKYTWNILQDNAHKLNPKTRGFNYPYTPKFEFDELQRLDGSTKHPIVPFVGTKTCIVLLRAWGVTVNEIYSVILCFSNVNIVKSDTSPGSNYFKIIYKGDTYFVEKFSKNKHPLTHRCSCKDFYFTWCWNNYYKARCIYGPAPQPYKRKTTWYPPRNPDKIIGVCKHIYNAWKFLQDTGLTQD